MKVLWFSNTPSLASEALNEKANVGGWIASLEKEVAEIEEIELGVAFPFGSEGKKQFKIGLTSYFTFPVFQDKGGRIGSFSRWKHQIEPHKYVEYYLEIIETFKPDLVHIFGTEQAYGLIIDKLNIPVVIHIQGNLSVYEKKWFSGLSNLSIFRYSGVNTLIQAYGLWHSFYLFQKRALREREIMKKCSYFIGRTDWDRRISKVLSPNRKYFHNDELLRKEFYTSKKWEKPGNSKVRLLSTISTMAYKGIETILETSELMKKNNLLDIEWHIVGVKGTEEVIHIAEKTCQLKFADYSIKFLGNLGPETLVEELLQADCYIHPSHIENSPNSVCEAMLLGLPVIATYAGGTPSLITNGKEGLLVQDGDPYSLAGTITELYNDENLMRQLSENAIQKAGERHHIHKVTKDLVEIYQTILEDYSK